MSTVTVRYFAVLRERKGVSDERVEVSPGTTLGELYRSLFPSPTGEWLPVACAKNHEYASADELVEDGDDIAFLPPLGGG